MQLDYHKQHQQTELPKKDTRKEEDSNFEKMSDKEIWALFSAGQEDAFIHIYNKYFSLLFGFGCQFTQDKELVKDCIQEMFIYMRQKLKKSSKIDSIKFYLFVSLRNRIVKTLKKNSFLSFVRGVQLPEDAFGFESAHEIQLINQQLSEEKSAKLLRALNKLTIKQREAVTYFFYDGLSYSQVAVLMNLKATKSARKLIYRSLNSLRENM